MNKLRVHLVTDPHSTGRGIGFYTSHLHNALKRHPNITLTNKKPDLVHYPYFDLFYATLNPPTHIPSVVTIHDLTPLILPNFYPKGIKGRINLRKQKLALRKVAAILTDSQNSKSDIAKELDFDSGKIHVTPLAIDPIYSKDVTPKQLDVVKQKYSLPDKFALYVGGVNPNKNLPKLIRATHKLGLPLVFVGSEFTRPAPVYTSLRSRLGLQPTHPEQKDLHFIKRAMNSYDHLSALGFVDSQDLTAIYRLATLYCQPSLYEGFGLPVLEAMTSGCLVVSSSTSSLPEIYPEGTLSFDPTDLRSMTKALKTALNLNKRNKTSLIESALKRSKDFSWQKTADLTANVYATTLHH